jgi:predicted nucleic acid-binding protein
VITYLDASVILRRALQQPGPVIDLGPSDARISSALAEVECFRTIDRLRLLRAIDEVALGRAREVVYRAFESCDLLETGDAVLERASMPFPTSLKTLDAIHIATALVYREATGNPVRMATHDRALARASRSMGLEVIGVA